MSNLIFVCCSCQYLLDWNRLRAILKNQVSYLIIVISNQTKNIKIVGPFFDVKIWFQSLFFLIIYIMTQMQAKNLQKLGLQLEIRLNNSLIMWRIVRFNAERERERGDNGLFITLVPKVLNNLFLFVDLTTLETLLSFDWLVIKLSVQTTTGGLILCIIIGNVH